MKLTEKSVKDLSFYHSVIEPVDELHIVGVDYLEDLFNNATYVAAGEDVRKHLVSSAQFAKDIIPVE